MNIKKYAVSSLLLFALVFSFGVRVSAENDTARINDNSIVSGKTISDDVVVERAKICKVLDVNANGKLDTDDYITFKKFFDAKDIKADINGDGNVNINDTTAFMNGYAACNISTTPYNRDGKDTRNATDPAINTINVMPYATETGTSCSEIDIDKNGKFNSDDFNIFRKFLDAGDIKADLNKDSKVNITDSTYFINGFAVCKGNNATGNGGTTTNVPPTLTGSGTSCNMIDADQNGKINKDDYTAFRKFLETGNLKADINTDKLVNIVDATFFMNGYASCIRNNNQDRDIKDDKSKDKSDNASVNVRANYERAFKNLDAYFTKFTQLGNLLEKRITALDNQKVNVSEAKKHLDLARGHLKNARIAIDTAKKLWAEISANNVNNVNVNSTSNTGANPATDPVVKATVSTDPIKGGSDNDVVKNYGSETNSKSASGSGGAKNVEGYPRENINGKALGDVTRPVKDQIKIAQKELEAAKKELMNTLKVLRIDDDRGDDSAKPQNTNTKPAPTVSVPTPNTTICKRVDANLDGSLNTKDFDSFKEKFAKNNKQADIDLNGSLNVNDFVAFQNGYATCIGATTSKTPPTEPAGSRE